MTIVSCSDINANNYFVPYDPSAPVPELHSGPKGGLRDDFMWGFATAAAQIEGGGEEKEKASGRGRSIWDMLGDRPGAIEDGSKVTDTCNHLELFKEDLALMKSYGVNTYRFSISWPRVIPKGGRDDPVNEKGIAFYNELIDECLRLDITPFVTLFHWDLPEELYHRYGGFLNKEEIVADFLRYSKLCFETFGDRVKNWLTFNEPWCSSALGYSLGRFAPAHQSKTEPWIVGHNILIAHAHSSKLYRSEYKAAQGGIIGITLNGDWVIPYDNSPENVKAAQDKMDAAVGWFADPLYLGHYPASLKKTLGDRLPEFTQEELALLKGSSEFYGMNFYTTHVIKAGNEGDECNGNTFQSHELKDGSFLGPESSLGWLRDVPWGLRAMLNYLYKRYNMPIYMTENGIAPKGESDLTAEEAVDDIARSQFYNGYLSSVRAAVVEDGVDIRSYLAWSFLDNFEWDSGLGPRFGVVHTDYTTKKRTPKNSAAFVGEWFTQNVGTQSNGTNGHSVNKAEKVNGSAGTKVQRDTLGLEGLNGHGKTNGHTVGVY